MHLETFLNMLLQSDQTIPPTGQAPNWEALASRTGGHKAANDWVQIPASIVSIGMNDCENDEGPLRYFGWDNEKPRRDVEVHSFETRLRPITNEDYAYFLQKTQRTDLPASWLVLPPDRMATGHPSNENDRLSKKNVDIITGNFVKDKFIRTVYGPVPLKYALDWPVMASYVELDLCAKFMNGRM